ncbi:MAG TPA: decarboxylating NADP(+)-dependent phosphogluconate dehydrogenase [Kiritimatiellia bacterium]|nr:decarboxylating NADP(+)-dependent phosphogluconate dehydrogenase [Kiritimatiellia bacterium]HRZ11228.1 decarboxylating NADP(+)-dependent phosphogluconate dehydrogenase [Kiritimatiellia bacterium]HSA19079.1 decarboxylating NADP(+)-dependent phosphogluconate dehydrogenase [Kiritimatiellia bacterium]
MSTADIGLVGLAVMGENLILNMESRGFTVACYNRTASKVEAFVQGRARGKKIIGCATLEDFCRALRRPRKVMLMIKAGAAVDAQIEALLPHLEAGDVIIDGGNSLFSDSRRRAAFLAARGLLFVGTGVSGGEEGALTGPSIMPGGHEQAWPLLRPIFQAIAARVDNAPCCEWIGADGAGHFVKMVHNGIEYGDMQMIAEAYALLKGALDLPADELSAVFREWNADELNSYLVEITADILAKKDDETGRPLLDLILDSAGQKGTGKWTSQTALDLGAAAPTMAEAVFARCLSALKDERMEASAHLAGPGRKSVGHRIAFIEVVRRALYASKICSYAQGFQIMRAAAAEYGWTLNYGAIAVIWRGGCIIRAQFLGRIKDAFEKQPDLSNLLVAPYFQKALKRCQGGWRRAVTAAVKLGIPVPAFSSALAYYDAYRSERLPANLLQAQRDYFGAHTYERIDKPRGQFFHTNWTGRGGTTASTTYEV